MDARLPSSLDGRRALITGGASGIGAALARRFAQHGVRTCLVDLPAQRANAEAVLVDVRAAGSDGLFVPADVTTEAQVDAAVARCRAELGGLEVVVAAAGVEAPPAHRLLDGDEATFRRVLDVNLTGTYLVLRAAARSMVDAGTPGSLVTVSSVAARRPSRGVYSISKASVVMLTRALATELGPSGIRVNAVAPGFIETPLLDRLAEGAPEGPEAFRGRLEGRVALGRLGVPDEVADVVLYLAGDESAYVTGSTLFVDGGHASTYGGG